jgi:hypothetical protein
VLVQLPPLSPAPRSSSIIAPVVITLAAIRDAADRGAPRTFAGKADNPAAQILQNADIGWTASRGPISATGAQDVLSLATPLTGTLNVTGSLSAKAAGAVGDALGSLLGGNAAKQIGSVNIKSLNANAEIKGNVTITARPKLAAAWRIEPNLTAQVTLGDTNLSVAGARVNVPAQVKPLIDKTVNDQLTAVQAKISNDPAFENSARLQWAKACRSIPLQGAGTPASLPALWLELRPTRAIAAQPRIDASAMTLTLGIEAETRITPAQTKPDCPFPATIVRPPPTPAARQIGVPIDVRSPASTRSWRRNSRAGLSPKTVRFGRRHRKRASSCIGRLAADLLRSTPRRKEFLWIVARPTCIFGSRCSTRPSRPCG